MLSLGISSALSLKQKRTLAQVLALHLLWQAQRVLGVAPAAVATAEGVFTLGEGVIYIAWLSELGLGGKGAAWK